MTVYDVSLRTIHLIRTFLASTRKKKYLKADLDGTTLSLMTSLRQAYDMNFFL